MFPFNKVLVVLGGMAVVLYGWYTRRLELPTILDVKRKLKRKTSSKADLEAEIDNFLNEAISSHNAHSDFPVIPAEMDIGDEINIYNDTMLKQKASLENVNRLLRRMSDEMKSLKNSTKDILQIFSEPRRLSKQRFSTYGYEFAS